jgi:hypothetical protein
MSNVRRQEEMYAFNTQFTIAPITPNDDISRALHLYQRLSFQGWFRMLLRKLIRRESRLLDLNNYKGSLPARDQHYAGIQSVSIHQIHGTQGKGSDFDAGFAPLNERTRSRWLKIAIARLQGTPLPPVELIQVEETYFVVDGHHRISVAKALGEQMIDAEITAWKVSGPLPWEKNPSPASLTTQPA